MTRGIFSLLAVLVWPMSLAAQPTPADIEEARALYTAGQAAALGERWRDAAANFERAYELSAAPPALFNMAFALRSMGSYQRASAAFSRLLTTHRDSLDEPTAARAEALLLEVQGRTATVRLDGLSTESYSLELDGVSLADPGQRPWAVLLDPGAHRLRLSRTGYHTFDWTGTLREGEHRAVSVRMLRVQLAEVPAVEAGPARVRSPWLWTIVGVVLVGAAVAIAVPLSQRDPQLTPQSMRSYRL